MTLALATPHIDWAAISPALVLLAAGSVNMLVAVLVPRGDRRVVAAIVCALGFLGALVAAAVLFSESATGHGVIADAIQRDRLGALATMVVAGAGLLTIGVSFSEPMADDHIAEYYSLLAWAGAGMAFLASASTLMTLFLGLEWFSISLYILCAIDVDLVGSLEAGLKYLIVGGFGSAMLLFGSALVYGATGRLEFHRIAAAVQAQGLSHDALLVTGLALVIGGLGFKASAAPFHMWTPDVYEGAPTPVTAFMSAATKTVALVLALRVLAVTFPHERHLWTVAVSVGAFAVVAARERELGVPVTIDNLAGFGWERPFLGVAMWTFMLGFAGFPLTGGFVGKFYVFAAAYRHGWTWLVILGVAATAVSLYYYLGVVRALFMRTTEDLQLAARTDARADPVRPLGGPASGVLGGGSPPREALLQSAVVACLIVTVGSFFAVQPLIDLAKHA